MNPRKTIRTFKALAALALVTPLAHADWHGGKVTAVFVAYDASTVTFTIAGYSRNNCTCYSAWPNTLCLNRDRPSFKEEVAMLYSVRARGGELHVNIDESTCSVVAMYEAD